MSIVSMAKWGVDTAATGAGKLDAFAKASEKALADGKDLNLFQDALRGVKIFGQAGMALQCLSMGLSALGMLLGGDKSQETQILDGIKEVLGRVDMLSKDMNTQFDQLSKQLNLQTSKLQLQSQLNLVENAEGYLEQINLRKAAGQPFDTLEGDLAQFDPTAFSAVMVQIYNSCVGTGTPTSPNVLSTLYDWSYGDVKLVWSMGEYLLHKATLAMMLHGIVEAIRAKTSGKDVDLDQIAGLYTQKLQDVADAVALWAGNCVSASERPKNVKRWLDAKKAVPLSIDAGDKQGSSKRIADELQKHYAYLNISVIVYDPVSGYDHHGVAGGGGSFMTAFQYPDSGNQPINIIIYWADRTATNRQAEISYQPAAADGSIFKGTAFQGARKDRSFDVTSSSHWPQRPSGARYQFVFDLTRDANAATNHTSAAAGFYGNWGNRNKSMSPFLTKFNSEGDSSKHESDSMIWFCFTDGFDDFNQTNIGLTSYNAMYGLVAPYTSICFWAR